jgi:hypothetical protein
VFQKVFALLRVPVEMLFFGCGSVHQLSSAANAISGGMIFPKWLLLFQANRLSTCPSNTF